MVHSMKRTVGRILAESHIAGTAFSDCSRVNEYAVRAGWNTTLCYWGSPHDTARSVRIQYASILETIKGMDDRCRISVKPEMFLSDMDVLTEIVQHAGAMGISVILDSGQPENTDVLLRLFERICGISDLVGFTIPARWLRSVHDLRMLVEWGRPVRLVKGQWVDPAVPSQRIHRQYLALVEAVARGTAPVSIATHDEALAAGSFRILSEAGVKCEWEQLFGLPWKSVDAAGYPDIRRRMYIPFGTPYLPYSFSDVQHRTEILYWMIRDLVLGRGKKLGLLALSGRTDAASVRLNGTEHSMPILEEHYERNS